MFKTGRSTCASVSALSFDAQPAQLDKLVRRICFPEGAISLIRLLWLLILVVNIETIIHPLELWTSMPEM